LVSLEKQAPISKNPVIAVVEPVELPMPAVEQSVELVKPTPPQGLSQLSYPALLTSSKVELTSSTTGMTRAEAEQRIRAYGHTYDLNGLTDEVVFSDLKSFDAAFARQVGRSVT
jgi:hypothetical protein